MAPAIAMAIGVRLGIAHRPGNEPPGKGSATRTASAAQADKVLFLRTPGRQLAASGGSRLSLACACGGGRQGPRI